MSEETNTEPKLLKIFYNPKGRGDVRFGDYELEETLLDWWKSVQSLGSQVLSTDQSIVIVMAQVLINEGKIPHTGVEVNIIKNQVGGSIKEWDTYKINDCGELYNPKTNSYAPMVFVQTLADRC